MDFAQFFKWVGALGLGVIGFFVRREIVRADDHEQRLKALEISAVTRKDIDELRHSLISTVVNAAERSEARLDTILIHMAEQRER